MIHLRSENVDVLDKIATFAAANESLTGPLPE